MDKERATIPKCVCVRVYNYDYCVIAIMCIYLSIVMDIIDLTDDKSAR